MKWWRERRKKTVTEKAGAWEKRRRGRGTWTVTRVRWTARHQPLRASLPTCGNPGAESPLWAHFSPSCLGDAHGYESLRTVEAWLGLSTVAAASHA